MVDLLAIFFVLDFVLELSLKSSFHTLSSIKGHIIVLMNHFLIFKNEQKSCFSARYENFFISGSE